MPLGKPAGVRCVQLDDNNACRLFGSPDRPAFCTSLRPQREMCGSSYSDAVQYLNLLEVLTS